MKLVPISKTASSAMDDLAALYGDGIWEIAKAAERKELSNTDKVLAASNAASAGIGVAAVKQMWPKAKANMNRTIPDAEAGGIPRDAARAAHKAGDWAEKKNPKLKPLADAARKPLKGLRKFGNSKAGAALVGGSIVGGTVFNATTDALSAKSILDKGKVQKSGKKGGLKPVILDGAEVAAVKARETAPLALKDASSVARRMPTKKGTAKTLDFVAEQIIAKADDDKRQVYGWVSVTEVNGQPVVDRQNDYITIEEVEKAAHEYLTSSRDGGDMHKRRGVSKLIESFVVTPEKKELLGLPEDTPTGWWCGFQVTDDDVWDMVKNGERPAFSIHGRGQRVETVI